MAPDTMLLTITSPPDDHGRQSFQLEWVGYRVDLNAQGPRGQLFRGSVAEHVRDLERRGWRIERREEEAA